MTWGIQMGESTGDVFDERDRLFKKNKKLRKRIAELEGNIAQQIIDAYKADHQEQIEELKAKVKRLIKGQGIILGHVEIATTELRDLLEDKDPEIAYYKTAIRGLEEYIAEVKAALEKKEKIR